LREAEEVLERGHVRWIDGLRAVAALAVMWFHLYNQNGGALVKPMMPDIFNHAAIIGRYGVEFFFVISGFVLSATLLPRRDISTGKHILFYFARRSIRLDPMLWCVIPLYVAAFPLISIDAGFAPGTPWIDPSRLFYSVFYFLPHSGDLYVPVAWTLAIEVQFYVFFALLVLFINRIVGFGISRDCAVFLLMLMMLALGSTTVFGIFNVPVGYWMLPHLHAFAIGATAAMVYLRMPKALLLFGLALAIAGFGAVNSGGRLLAAFLSGLVIAACLYMPSLQSLLSGRVILWLGALSYGIYLLHTLVGALTIKAIQLIFPSAGAYQVLVVLAGCVTTILAAQLLRHFVEIPSILWSKRIPVGERPGLKAS